MSNALFVCGGCNAKIGPKDLKALLSDLPQTTNHNLLIGFETSDDAAVLQINSQQVLIQTLDFFPPMVTDPYLFGKIAAANALSDIFAMGGEVLSALNIVSFPENEDPSLLKEILRGGAEKVVEAGGVLAGGHSIHDQQIKYGLSVNGLAAPDQILRNDSPNEQDVLILTKPLGVGIITAGYQIGEIDETAYQQAIEQMQTLNKYSLEAMRPYDISSCTDITGFGLLGHLHEMLHGCYSAMLYADSIPLIEGAYQGARQFVLTAGGQRNRNYLADSIDFQIDDFALEELLFDPQTSGGLLFTVAPNQVNDVLENFQKHDLFAQVIGQIIPKQPKEIIVF